MCEKIVLTPREIEILCYVVTGMSNLEIAEKLFISESTVKAHITSILRKFNMNSRLSIAVIAVILEIVDISTLKLKTKDNIELSIDDLNLLYKRDNLVHNAIL